MLAFIRSYKPNFVRLLLPQQTHMPSHTVLADDLAIEKPLLDDRAYRLFKLDKNDLHVLVISDPQSDRAAAAVDVNVGSFADKEYGISGLAHFCEHLLFMGTARYPEEAEYRSYLSKHSGDSNAYTAPEHTNYYFEVSADHLEGALDRFSQFFISPLFSKSCQDREIKAVDSENKKNYQLDSRRFYQLDRLTSNPEHPHNGFSTGNYQTLHEEPVSKNVDVRNVLLQYYKDHYLSNIMSLVILGKESLDELTLWAIAKFTDVPNANLPRPDYKGVPIYSKSDLNTIVKAKLIKDENSLNIEFPIPSDGEEQWESMPADYYSHLLGHESAGLVYHLLREKKWANGLSCYGYPKARGAGIFRIRIELTEEGLRHWEEAVVHVFEYLAMLQQQGPQKWIWKEQSDMSKIEFRYRQKLGVSGTVSRLSNELYKVTDEFYIPPESLLSMDIVRDYKPEDITEYGLHLVPSNFRLFLSSQLFDDLPQREKWYGTEYLYDPILFSLLEKVKVAQPTRDLHLPKPNAFIPESFHVKGHVSEKPLPHPYLIKDTAQFETWFKQDDRFKIPQGSIDIALHVPTMGRTLESSVSGMLLTELFSDHLNDTLYYASLVQLKVTVTFVRGMFLLSVSGYNDKLHVLLEHILKEFVGFRPNERRFEAIKSRALQQLRNFAFKNPYMQARTHYLQFVNENVWANEERSEAMTKTTYQDLVGFSEKLWSKGVFSQTLLHGNFDYTDALNVSQIAEKILGTFEPISHSKDDVKALIGFQSHILKPGENVLYEHTLQDPANVNSCLDYFIQVGKAGNEDRLLRVLTLLLTTVIDEPCFSALRTREQLGYVVFSGFRENRTHFGVRILVQSERTADYLEYRVESFLEILKEREIIPMSEETFERFKLALKSTSLKKFNNLSEETEHLWEGITSGFYDFKIKERDVEILESITRDDFVKFFNDYIQVNAPKSGRLAVHLKSQKPPHLETSKLFNVAVHNALYEFNVAVDSDIVDSIVAERDSASAVYDAIAEIKALKIGTLVAKQAFVSNVEQNTKYPTPKNYPKGVPYLRTKFKDTHEKGGLATPVAPLKDYYYPHDKDARL